MGAGRRTRPAHAAWRCAGAAPEYLTPWLAGELTSVPVMCVGRAALSNGIGSAGRRGSLCVMFPWEFAVGASRVSGEYWVYDR